MNSVNEPAGRRYTGSHFHVFSLSPTDKILYFDVNRLIVIFLTSYNYCSENASFYSIRRLPDNHAGWSNEMSLLLMSTILIFAIIYAISFFYLLTSLKRDKQLLALIGLFCLAMGFILLIIDLLLLAFTQGVQHIPEYLLFNRLVSDTGFAGRWVLTVYLFICTGVGISFYTLATNIRKKFNEKKRNS